MNDPSHPPCRCGSLEEASKDPELPIRWDAARHEFHIVFGDDGRLIVRFCISCGGRAPESRRDDLFHRVEHDEEARLVELLSGLGTVGEITARLGEPDRVDEAAVWYSGGGGDRPQQGEAVDVWVYEQLSTVADVLFEVRGGAVRRGRWTAKWLGAGG